MRMSDIKASLFGPSEIETGIRDLIASARTFVQRVESGEVRSKRTYAEFKEALRKIDEGQ